MGCPCKEKVARIRCNNCQNQTSVSYTKGEDILAVAAKLGKKCRQCGGTDFSVV